MRQIMEYLGRENSCFNLEIVEHKRSYAGHTIYRVVLKVCDVGKPGHITEIFVWRRYKEFKKLYRELKSNLIQNAECNCFPELSKAKLFGRYDANTIEERMQSIKIFLDFIAKNHTLSRSTIFIQFFEGAIKSNNANHASLRGTEDDAPIYFSDNSNKSPVFDTDQDNANEASTNLSTATWNDRQPTPELPDDDNIASSIDIDPVCQSEFLQQEDDSESLSSREILGNVLETDQHMDNVIMNTSTLEEHDEEHCVFSDDKTCIEDETQWFQRAFSICSDGDDINVLASKGNNSMKKLDSESTPTEQNSIANEASLTDCSVIDEKQVSDATLFCCDQNSRSSSTSSSLSFLPGMQKEEKTDNKGEDLLRRCSIHFSCECASNDECGNNNNSESYSCLDRDGTLKATTVIENIEKQPGSNLSTFGNAGNSEYLPIECSGQYDLHLKNTCHALSLSSDEFLANKIRKVIEEDDYIYQGSLAISEAMEQEAHLEFEAAFESYKLGIGLLLEGVKQDDNAERCKAVRRKTAQYLLKAEGMYKKYLKELNDLTVSVVGTFQLSEIKALGIIDNVVLVERISTGKIYILKVLHKGGAEYKSYRTDKIFTKQNFVNSKFMVNACFHIESNIGIYLLLEYVPTGLLWRYLYSDWSSDVTLISSKKGDCETIDKPPEDLVRIWVAEMVLAIENLHKNGIICRDLNPRNILLDENGHIKLTYFSQFKGVEYGQSDYALRFNYASPESHGAFQLTKATDWWSLGAVLFELLTGKSLHSCYPNGIHSHSIIHVPTFVSNEAWSLLSGLLRYSPQERLGAGAAGCEEIKSHPFFVSVDWQSLEQ